MNLLANSLIQKFTAPRWLGVFLVCLGIMTPQLIEASPILSPKIAPIQKGNHGVGKGNSGHSKGSKGFSQMTKSNGRQSGNSGGARPTISYRPSTHNHAAQQHNAGHSSNLHRGGFNNGSHFSSNRLGRTNIHLDISPFVGGSLYSGSRLYQGGGYSQNYRPTYSYSGVIPNRYGTTTYQNYSYALPPSTIQSSIYSSPPLNYSPLSSSESLATSNLMSGAATGMPFPKVNTNAAARSLQQRAEHAFRSGDYNEADRLATQAVRLDSENGRLLLFAAQTSFAIGNYTNAARYTEKATAILPSDQWGSIVQNFRDFYGRNHYVSQTEQLNEFLQKYPEDYNALAIRGYHFGLLGYTDSATRDFDRALQSNPTHVLTKRLLPVLGVKQEIVPPEEVQAPIPTEIAPIRVPTTPAREELSIIRLVPQFTDEELRNAVPVKRGREIPLSGPGN